MNIYQIFFEWYFWDFPNDIVSAWKKILKFFWEYFSVGLTLKTLFSPWRAWRWQSANSLDIGQNLSAFGGNFVSSFVGFLVRIVYLFFILQFIFLVLVAGPILTLVWLFLPLLAFIGFAYVIF